MKPSRVAVAAALVLAAQGASAQETSVATARQLAISGIDAVESGNCEKGAPLLERAEQLHHASVHLQYLARCKAAAGRLVAATEMWRRIIREGAPAGSSPAVTTALNEAQAELEKALPRLAKTTIRASGEYPNLSLAIDGTQIPANIVGVEQILDPGEHELVANAPGYASWSKRWTLAESGTAEVVVELAPLPAGSAPDTLPGGETPGEINSSSGSLLWPIGWITASVGAASLIGGTVTLLTRNNRRDDLASKCPNPTSCPEGAFPGSKLEDEKSTISDLTTASNVLLWGGGVLLAGGVTMIVIASQSSGKEPQTALVFGAPRATAGLTLQGRW